MKAVYHTIDKKRRQHTFELFGYDFMVDENFKVYLIEANINPCLGVTSAFSSRFIPTLVDNTLRIALDPLYPSPPDYENSKKNVGDILPEIRYELIFDQRMEAAGLDALYNGKEQEVICNIKVYMYSRSRRRM
jgi:tubulin monoglycylase TTLL3/8